jgi:hypothetical protein
VVGGEKDKKKQYNVSIFEKTFNKEKEGNEIKKFQLLTTRFRLMKSDVESSGRSGNFSGRYMEIILPVHEGFHIGIRCFSF